MLQKSVLFIHSIASHDWDSLKSKCIVLLIIYTGVLIAIIVDLIRGLHRAKQRGELRTSYGLRKTIDKTLKYYSLLILFSIADVIASLIIGLPYFTMISGLFIIGIEVKSWFEKASDKDKNDMVTIARVIKDKDILKSLIDFIEKENSNKKK